MTQNTARKTVLLVDDDPDILTQMSAALRTRYEVRTASSGKDCLAAVAASKPDCIVMDVMMGEMCEGLETAKLLKSAPATRTLPILMLTSVNQSYDYRAQVDASYFPHDTWLDKPVKGETLLREVTQLIGA